MKIEKTAKTVELAIADVLKELNANIEDIEYEVLQKETKGFFGLFKKEAKIIAFLKEDKIKKDEKPQNVYNEEYKANKIENIYQKLFNEKACEIAEDFLIKLFEKMKLDVKITAKMDRERGVFIDIEGENLGGLIGKRGETLDALQYITNLVINKGEFAYIPINLDIQKYREKRKKTLEELADNLAKRVYKTQKPTSLEPMKSYERRVIHNRLKYNKFVKTSSKGKEPFRYVMILPKKAYDKKMF